MKSYLSLIPISARVRRRQNRLTILCIVTAVFLVTAIFSVADMMLRTQTGRAAGKSGSWHLEVTGITPEQAAQLVGQPDVVRVGAGAVFNENGESAYRLNGKRVVLYGADADYVSLNRAAAFAGTYPQAENEVLLGKTAARVLHVGSGDTVTLTLPDGTEKPLTVTGVGGIDEDFYGAQYSIVLGDDEIANGEAVLKNMKTGEKKKISLNDDFVDTYITAVTEQEDAMPITF